MSCTIVGTEGNDTLTGTPQDDVICGLAGNDTIDGGAGAGADIILGGPGDDTLRGGPGADCIIGGPGHDRLPDANTGDQVIDEGARPGVVVEHGRCRGRRSPRGESVRPPAGEVQELPAAAGPGPVGAVKAGSFFVSVTRALGARRGAGERALGARRGAGERAQPPFVTVDLRSVRVTGGVVRVPLLCARAVSGDLTLSTIRSFGGRPRTLGAQSFDCGAEGFAIVTIHLTSKDGGLLQRVGRLQVSARVVVRDASGQSQTDSTSFILSAPRR